MTRVSSFPARDNMPYTNGVRRCTGMFTVKDKDFSCNALDWDYEYGDPAAEYTTIINPRVTKVDVDALATEVIRYCPEMTEIDKYAVSRIFRIKKLYDSTNWEVRVGRGYYGEEVDGVYIRNEVASDVDTMLSTILCLWNEVFKVEELLRLEYGELLPELENRAWMIHEIPVESVTYFNEAYRKRLNPADVAVYDNYNGVRGVVIPKNGGYRLIDGYHRFEGAKGTAKFLIGCST